MDKFMNGYSPIYEISSEAEVSGRRKIKVVLHEIHQDEGHYQENGISWSEAYTRNNMPSVVGMSIVAEFINEDRDIPYGHGMTDMRADIPLFEDATMVGHFDSAYIDDIILDGESKRVLIAEGTLDEMRYPKFVEWLRSHMAEGVVKGSVEIVGKAENDHHILYEDGWKERGRVPKEYDYSGYAILTISPADEAAIVMELNNRTETGSEAELRVEDVIVDETMKNEIRDLVSNALAEVNSKWEEFMAQISAKDAEIVQLQADIEQKNAEIAQIQADMAQYQADTQAKDAGLAEANAKVAALEQEKAMGELNAALEPFNETQREVAKAEIEAFTTDPGSVEINSIVGKICTEMVRLGREAAKESEAEIDVFGMMNDGEEADDQEEVRVF